MAPTARTLHVRCSTWEQVEVFTTRKLRKGRLLSMKVPFDAPTGTQVTLGLELPNQIVIAIDGMVQRASAIDNDPKSRTWIELELIGFTDDVMTRIREMARAAAIPANAPAVAALPPRKGKSGITGMGDDLPADERALFQHLAGELRRLRAAAVHDVLGVAVDASPEEIRTGWKNLVRRHHPDLVARRGAAAISHLAEELTILSNRAYDRLRAAVVAEGRGNVIGPTLTSPPGWLVGFDDMASGGKTPAPEPRQVTTRFDRHAEGTQAPPERRSQPTINPTTIAAAGTPSTIQGGEAFEQRARAMLAEGDANAAREVLAAALVIYPRSKSLRSLYYVASALVALGEGELMLATSQLEAAIAHHEHCVEAVQMLDHVRKDGTTRVDELRRLFR
ncbi:MAG TPA: J domain-containing protein [Kofleriaceae bacterium]